MLNRRIIRIKIMQLLYAYFSGSVENLDDGQKRMNYTFMRIYDLYHLILLLFVELSDYSQMKMEQAKKKMLPTEEDLNPNLKFVNNKLIAQIRDNKQLKNYLSKKKFSWFNYEEMLKEIYEDFTSSEDFKKYMKSDDLSYNADKMILRYLIEVFLYNSESFYNYMEMQSIFWVDNVDFVLLSVVITIENMKITDDENKPLLRLYKNNDDRDFAKLLLDKVILKHTEYEKIIKLNIVNWDFNRIAVVDKTILLMAIAEFLDFSEIPVKVTLNEYIDIAKQYGIPNKSFSFVNGILDKILKYIKREKLLNKTGRGLYD